MSQQKPLHPLHVSQNEMLQFSSNCDLKCNRNTRQINRIMILLCILFGHGVNVYVLTAVYVASHVMHTGTASSPPAQISCLENGCMVGHM